jgi:hypothetical protein
MTQETLTAYAIDRFKDLAAELKADGLDRQDVAIAAVQAVLGLGFSAPELMALTAKQAAKP